MLSTPQGKRSAVALVAACSILTTAVFSGTGSAAGQADTQPAAVPGELLVRFEPGARPARRAALRELAGVTLERRLLLPRLQLVRTRPGLTVAAAINALEAQPGVDYAEPNYLYEPLAIPDDPRFGDQWALLNSGQTIQSFPGVAGADISAPAAWDTSTGSREVKVAVIDSGINYEHPDLAANVWTNPGEAASGEWANGIDDDGNDLVDDLYGWDFYEDDANVRGGGDGHGTGVAGIVGAVGNNGLGVSGVNWRVGLVALVAGTSAGVPSDAVTDSIGYADRVGADVANMSFGNNGHSGSVFLAIAAAADTLFVAGAGNSGSDNDTVGFLPCEYELPNVVCVAATNNRDELANFSSYGATSVDLAAPGEDILAPFARYRELFSDDFETPVARWDYTQAPLPATPGKWRRVAGATGGGGAPASTHVLQDSEGSDYPDNADTRVTLQEPIDLAAADGCFVRLDASVDTESAKDHLRVEAAAAPGGPYTELARLSGDTPTPWTPVVAQLGAFEGGDLYLRLRLTSDGANTAGGASVDNVRVACDDPAQSYSWGSGTSLSTPQVTGAAALVKAHMPDISVAELRERLLRTVDRLPSLEGKVVTGGRLNVERALTADLTPPAATIDSSPAPLTSSRAAAFSFSSSKPGTTFACSLDGQEFTPCSSPAGYSALADGGHNFAVRATDEFGITGSAAEADWVVDATAPAVTITDGPAASTTANAASFSFTASEPVESYECSLDGGAFATCSSPRSYEALEAGAHSFAVKARDGAGNWSAAASRGWTITEPSPPPDGGGGGDEPEPEPEPAEGGDPPPPDPDPDPSDGGLVAPRPDDAEPKAWSAPEIGVEIPRQTLRRVLRKGFRTRTVVGGKCPCRLVQRLRLDRRLARRLGLVAGGTRRRKLGPAIGRTRARLAAEGRVRTRLRVGRRVRKRLRTRRRVDTWVETRVKDSRGLATIVRQQVRVRR